MKLSCQSELRENAIWILPRVLAPDSAGTCEGRGGRGGGWPGGLAAPVYSKVSEQQRLIGGRKCLPSSPEICSEAGEAHFHNLMPPNYVALFFIKRNGNTLLNLCCNIKYT